jgi:hypothetical protein
LDFYRGVFFKGVKHAFRGTNKLDSRPRLLRPVNLFGRAAAVYADDNIHYTVVLLVLRRQFINMRTEIALCAPPKEQWHTHVKNLQCADALANRAAAHVFSQSCLFWTSSCSCFSLDQILFSPTIKMYVEVWLMFSPNNRKL